MYKFEFGTGLDEDRASFFPFGFWNRPQIGGILSLWHNARGCQAKRTFPPSSVSSTWKVLGSNHVRPDVIVGHTPTNEDETNPPHSGQWSGVVVAEYPPGAWMHSWECMGILFRLGIRLASFVRVPHAISWWSQESQETGIDTEFLRRFQWAPPDQKSQNRSGTESAGSSRE